jgi:hypothetical protein
MNYNQDNKDLRFQGADKLCREGGGSLYLAYL